jgi:tripartite-type tricarboxylate transporter receptor subunit TctC
MRVEEIMRRFIICLVAGISVVALVAGTASAATWPEKGKVIPLYVGAGAGGGADMAGRAIAQLLEPEMGVKFVIINKAPVQACFQEFLAKSGTDGYTLILGTTPSAHAPYLDPDRKATYSMKDIQLVVNYASSPVAMGVKKGRYKSLKEVVDKAKANPGKVKITASGPLTPADYGIILLEKTAGVSFGHMFFDQQGEQRAALLGDHVDVESNISFELIPGQKSGEIETLAVLDTKESIYLPGVKTAEAQGFKGVNVGYGVGLSVKMGTPKAIVDTLASTVKKISTKPECLDLFKKLGLGVDVKTGQEYADAWKYSEDIVKAVLDDMKKMKK